MPVEGRGRVHRSGGRLVRVDEESVLAIADELGHRTALGGDDRRAAGHRLHDAEAERLVEVDEVHECPRSAEERVAPIPIHRPDVRHTFPVDERRDEPLEVPLVLDDPGEDQGQPDAFGDLDRLDRPFVRMDPSEEQQIAAGSVAELELAHVDAVMNRRHVIESRVPVGIADGDVVASVVVLLEHRHDPFGRKAVDRRQHRRFDEAAVRERQKVEAVVDQVELCGTLEDGRDVQRLPHLRVQIRSFRIAGGSRPDQPRPCRRVGRGEQRHVDATIDEALGQERDEQLPRPVVPRRNPPRDRREHRNPELRRSGHRAAR